jgi:hypothetical protein
MKKATSLLTGLLVMLCAYSQQPVSWNYAVKHVEGNVYEVHLTAAIQQGWHLYSQTQPENAIAVPTSIKFGNNPLLQLDGKIKEIGVLHKINDTTLDIGAWQYSGMVDFVQRVVVKAVVKTNINGSIQFQVCTDERCLPAATKDFIVTIK